MIGVGATLQKMHPTCKTTPQPTFRRTPIGPCFSEGYLIKSYCLQNCCQRFNPADTRYMNGELTVCVTHVMAVHCLAVAECYQPIIFSPPLPLPNKTHHL